MPFDMLLGHLVGDYLLQNDWMAANKKKRTWVAAVHALVWMAAVVLIGWRTAPPVAIGLLWLSHLLQDRTDVVRQWMFLVGQRAFATGPCSPWSIIVVDNVWHLVVMRLLVAAFGT